MIKTRKIVFNKTGKTYVPKLIIPTAWAEFLSITPDANEVDIELVDNKIIIRKAGESNVSRETFTRGKATRKTQKKATKG